MKILLKRLGKLENRYSLDDSKPALRLVVSFPWKGPINWQKSTCSRVRGQDGSLTEVVRLEGDDRGLSKEELDRYVAAFPIQARS
jgi:hypothetical protein